VCVCARVCSEQKSTSAGGKKQTGTPGKSGGKKSQQRKDDDWEEVSRKYVSSLSSIGLF